ncbi:hypothetical protein FE257_001131 [Aspergillus nanangensis]|uniref:6-phosphogluconate dehydrogenase NADP-binding domain-containing protein n=1 Tax=Aspergillus nanangensis TaxID=2582783 RepID=A0AAD4CU33_ASPNN|nr:hypothetical protein FE257_001131 [Aspergillus nanangensis]
MTPRLSFIGLGPMGMAISESLFRYGEIARPLVLYNRTREKAETHRLSLGGDCRVADTIVSAVDDSDVIWLCLQNEEAVESTFQAIFSTDIQGKIFVDSSTTSPEMADSIAQRVLEAGAEFVAVPGRNTVDLSGEKPGAALLLKLMGNFLIMATIETVAEAHVFADKCGIGTKTMEKLMRAVFPNPPHALYNDQMLSGEYFAGKPLVEVSKALLLTGHVSEMAKRCGASVKIYEIAREHLKVAKEHEGPDADITAIYGAVRVESGLPFRNDAES